jgi:hypothetical protein
MNDFASAMLKQDRRLKRRMQLGTRKTLRQRRGGA